MTFGEAVRRVEVLMLAFIGFLLVFGMSLVYSDEALARQVLTVTRGSSEGVSLPSVLIEGGFFYAEVFAILIAFLIGMGLIGRDISSNLLGVILSRQVTRWQYLGGKYLGGLCVPVILFVLYGVVLVVFYVAKTGAFNILIEGAVLLTAFKISLFFSLVLLFSQILPGFVAAVVAALIYGGGYTWEKVQALTETATGFFRPALEAANIIFPHLSQVSLSGTVWADIWWWTAIYGVFYNGAALAGAFYLFSRRSL